MKAQFSNLGEFLNMDGYAAYVFTAYGLALITMLGLLFLGLLNAKKAQKRLLELESLKNEKN